jgi:RNA 2',3'-cyclic 3'-phosphodiesterase
MTVQGRDGGREPITGTRHAGAQGDEVPWRLFIALPVPGRVRDALAAALDPVRSRVRNGRWQDPGTWHLTLRFLGDTPSGSVPAIEAVMHDAATSQPAFEASLGRAGSFAGRGGRVAWVGLEQGVEPAARLAGSLAVLLGPGEIAREPFRAHLTIARDAPDGLVQALQAALDAARMPAADPPRVGLGRPPQPVASGDALAWTVDRLVLYRSVLGRGGAVHTEIAEAHLEG